MRFAIFFAPRPDHPLWKAAALWIGRDAFTGELYPPSGGEGLTPDEVDALTAEPRRYGFHATLKAPFRLAPRCDENDLMAALDTACRALGPVSLPRLDVTRIASFFAFTPAAPSDLVNGLADAVVRHFDHLRAPLTEVEVSRRRPQDLTPSQRHNLERWGYPYVFADYRFHMTLTGPVPGEQAGAVERLLRQRFGAFVGQPLDVDALSLFVEPAPMADFIVRQRMPLAAGSNTVGRA